MALFAGKSTTERNKIIAAAVLGLVALVALYMAFGRSFFGGGTTTAATAKSSPTPRPAAPPNTANTNRVLPTVDEQRFLYETTPVDYRPGNSNAPDPGRNIFAFYEPPPPCNPNKPGDCPTPTPKPTPPPPTPTPPPPPPILLRQAIPANVYAGARGFRMEVDGATFTPETRIYFNGTEMPTTFLNAQRLAAEITANLIAQEGPRQIEVRTPDGRLYSNQTSMMVNPPPKPTVQYIGMIGRKRYNNDTAYFMNAPNTLPFGARLNDVVSGQFRLIDISASEVIFEDVNLGFRHRVLITKNPVAAGAGSGFPFAPGGIPQGDIPGIPAGIQRYVQPQPQQVRKPTDKKDDVDDKDDPPQ